ncbi:MAG TPA: hypothetical protein VGQ57_08415 [Polyangiaceae bacterium]|nr:hypothetical protein [Polyangiaceae bacterium]
MSDLRPSFAFEVVRDLELLVSYQGPRNPSDEEWDGYLEVLGRLHQVPNNYRYFTISEGGHPSGAQQARVKALVNGRTPAVAIVSSSIAMRFVGSVLALINRKVQCFRPDQLRLAYAHLAVPDSDVPRLEMVVARLREKVSEAAAA